MPWAAAVAVAGAYITSQGAQSAADTQAGAARDASANQMKAAADSNQTQRDMQQNALNFQLGQTSPYTNAGKTALSEYLRQLGLPDSAGGNASGSFGSSSGAQQPQMTRDQIRTQLLGQFTKGNGGPNMSYGSAENGYYAMDAANNATEWHAGSPQQGGTVDEAGLNAAIDKQMQQQGQFGQRGGMAASSAVNNGQQTPFDVSKMPGYDFIKKEATDATNNSASAGAGALSGNAQKALQDRMQGLATTQYGSYLDRIAGLVSLGGNAATNNANNGVGIIQGAAGNISANQMALGNNLASNAIGTGNTQAAAGVAGSNAWGSAANTVMNSKALSSIFGGSNYDYSGTQVPSSGPMGSYSDNPMQAMAI